MPLMKPLLADNKVPKLEEIKYPVYASRKYDGLRATVQDGTFMSRSLKPLPNRYLQSFAGSISLSLLDGELIVGPPNLETTYHTSESALMSADGEPDFTFYVFDFLEANKVLSFERRLDLLKDGFQKIEATDGFPCKVVLVEVRLINNEEELLAFEQQALDEGYEGLILRSITGVYKQGRSTFKEAYSLKLKRYKHGEAVIVDTYEMMHNTNKAKINELGYQERSSHKAGKVGSGMLGGFVVRDLVTGTEFRVGNGEGITHEMRKQWWIERNTMVDKIIRYKWFPKGCKDKPRHPLWTGFRDPIDMGE